ncbi:MULTISPECIES: hypothetical protein [unclassified Breznakia]|uniref:hypothetical protein n=1 Tax=unclassified Breznakia TaxID=2623764 RepID=UPI0024734C0C|nr:MULTISPECIES: hypothetical protein [unclassified Breznakia]MDH6367049.1 hypothetical protein [Breznakia sp. PH1-1]MDH6404179.1 hypothetical protein [Breznakia sp. PF1-11]MDH6411936.1 hypothetical protein [Breznakia sp. PFB1-11]MDH6414167.1 hypothetical protein [Breznakia sp. PFB1-14]MDH6418920.1 hypothetical protein [Breznakia sp. PFB1-12]
MKKHDIYLTIHLRNKDYDQFKYEILVPNDFDDWDFEKQNEYINEKVDSTQFQREIRKELYIVPSWRN